MDVHECSRHSVAISKGVRFASVPFLRLRSSVVILNYCPSSVPGRAPAADEEGVAGGTGREEEVQLDVVTPIRAGERAPPSTKTASAPSMTAGWSRCLPLRPPEHQSSRLFVSKYMDELSRVSNPGRWHTKTGALTTRLDRRHPNSVEWVTLSSTLGRSTLTWPRVTPSLAEGRGVGRCAAAVEEKRSLAQQSQLQPPRPTRGGEAEPELEDIASEPKPWRGGGMKRTAQQDLYLLQGVVPKPRSAPEGAGHAGHLSKLVQGQSGLRRGFGSQLFNRPTLSGQLRFTRRRRSQLEGCGAGLIQTGVLRGSGRL